MSSIRIFRDFFSYPEQSLRTLRVYVPDAVQENPELRCGVLYMLDGQNVFAHDESALYHTWCANWAIDEAIASGDLPPWIIVAVDHLPGRFDEYTPFPFSWRPFRPQGKLLLDCLCEHIKPFVDSNFPTLTGPQHCGLMGASLGGLMTMYMGYLRPDVFGRMAAISPTFSWSDGRIFEQWKQRHQSFTRIYIDCGSEERIWLEDLFLDYPKFSQDFHDHLRGLGYQEHELRLVIEEGGHHHELDWQRRFPSMIRWLLAD